MEPTAVDGERVIRRLKGLELREDVRVRLGVCAIDVEELDDLVTLCEDVTVMDELAVGVTLEDCGGDCVGESHVNTPLETINEYGELGFR